MRVFDGRSLAGNDKACAIHADGNGHRLFNSREILIEFAKKPDRVFEAL